MAAMWEKSMARRSKPNSGAGAVMCLSPPMAIQRKKWRTSICWGQISKPSIWFGWVQCRIRFFWRIGSLETNGSGYPKNELVAAHHISHALSRRLASFSLPATRPRLKCGCVVRARYKWLRSGCGWVSLTVNPPHVCDSSRSKSALNETRRRIGETECRDGSRCRGSAHACGAIERLAVQGSPQDRGAAHAIPQGRGDLRDRLWPIGLAAYRYVRRSRPHHHRTPCIPRPHRGQGTDPSDRILGRHGRTAKGPRQHPEQGDGSPASRQAAHPGARPVRHSSKLWRPQQCEVTSLSGCIRVRLRVHVVDRVLRLRSLR